MVAWLASETNRNNAEGGETRTARMWQLEDSQVTHQHMEVSLHMEQQSLKQ
jgi:hypothetical protein